MSPNTAFQKPITVQGRVTAKTASMARSMADETLLAEHEGKRRQGRKSGQCHEREEQGAATRKPPVFRGAAAANHHARKNAFTPPRERSCARALFALGMKSKNASRRTGSSDRD